MSTNNQSCDFCNTELVNEYYVCGAPVCCPVCCREDFERQNEIMDGCDRFSNCWKPREDKD